MTKRPQGCCLRLQGIPLGIEDLDFSEEGGLGFDLSAVTGEDDLQVGGIEIFSRDREQLLGGNGTNLGAIGFEVIVGQFVLRNGGKLREQTVLRGEAERKDAA